jgi:hypothetical protein
MGGSLENTILGVNRRSVPSQVAAEGYVDIVVVLVAGAIGDYAAYMGQGSPEWVARFGNKISFEEACGHFPGGQLSRERYRL